MKIKIYLGLILLNVFNGPVFSQTNLYVDRIIAKIGGEIILYSDLQDQKAYVKERQGGALNEEDDCAILENLFLQDILTEEGIFPLFCWFLKRTGKKHPMHGILSN